MVPLWIYSSYYFLKVGRSGPIFRIKTLENVFYHMVGKLILKGHPTA